MMKNNDFNLLRGFADKRLDKRTDEQTFVIVESPSRLKMFYNLNSIIAVESLYLRFP